MAKHKVVELGCTGHFIAAANCHWRRHTQVGDCFRVSSVGDYFPRGAKERYSFAGREFFETMVFRTNETPAGESEDCGCRDVKDWNEIDSARYQTAGEAQRGHEAMVAKYRRRV